LSFKAGLVAASAHVDLRSLPLVGGGAGSGIANPQKHSNVHCKLSDNTQYGQTHSKDTVTTKATTLQTLGKHRKNTTNTLQTPATTRPSHGKVTAERHAESKTQTRHGNDIVQPRQRQGHGYDATRTMPDTIETLQRHGTDTAKAKPQQQRYRFRGHFARIRTRTPKAQYRTNRFRSCEQEKHSGATAHMLRIVVPTLLRGRRRHILTKFVRVGGPPALPRRRAGV